MLGNVKNEAGLLFNKGNFKLVKKVLKKDEKIAKHNHENEEIIFTVLKGILHFDGVNFINGAALEDSEVSVTLIKK